MGNVSDIALERALAHLLTEHSKPVSSEYLRTDEIYNPTLQIDWVTAKVPFYYKGKLNGGNIINTTPDGEIEYSIDKRLPITGSYDSRLSVRTSDVLPNGDTWQIEISGNPVKWFQGHNVFGSSDLPNLIYETVIKLSKVLNSPQPDDWLSGVKRGCYTLSRVDITGMYSLPSRSDVYAWLNHAEKTARTRAGTAISKGNTVYLNKTSARWNVVMYSKGLELEKHELPKELDGCGLDDYSDNKLRVELRLRGKELSKLNLKIGLNWLDLDPFLVFKDYVGRVEMTEQNIREEDLFDIPKYARMTYELWSKGVDVRQFVSIRKYYKDRKALLEFGIDISVPKPLETNVNVIPLRKVLQLEAAGVPSWAYGTNLMFEPRKICG